jgi:hypothetical protein
VSPIDSIFDEPALRGKSAAIASASTQRHDGDHFHEGVIEQFGGNGTVASPLYEGGPVVKSTSGDVSSLLATSRGE